MPGQARILAMTVLVACLFRPGVLAAEDSHTRAVDHQATLLVRQLRSTRQPERVRAQRELAALGGPAIPEIERALERAALDQLPYLISALERMFVAGCLPDADEAERTLERLSHAGRSAVAGRAAAILTAHQQLRERRAVAALRELGVDVLYAPPEQSDLLRAWPVGASEIVVPGHDLTKLEVWLHDDMAGGEEALWHVTRLEHNWSVRTWGITVYSIDGNGVSSDAVQRLAGRLNSANIQERGASLGISCNTRFDGCQIEKALPGGTAAAAGLRQGDEILAIDSEPVTTFWNLVDRLLERSAGESATLTYRRFGNAPQEIEVTLGNWRPLVEERRREIEESRVMHESIQRETPDRFWLPPNMPVR